MISLLVFILIGIIFLNWRRIFPLLMLYFINRMAKKMEKQSKRAQPPTNQKKKPKTTETLGDYIDFEEID